MGLHSHFNVSHVLRNVQNDFHVCVSSFFCKSLVKFLGHCFRHLDHPISKLLSLPLRGRLTDLRIQGRRSVPSSSAQVAFDNLLELGLEVGQLITGRPCIRGDNGCALRWGEGWFEEVRDGGVGWSFTKEDTAAIDHRMEVLLSLFRRESRLPRLGDVSPLALPYY